MRKKISRWTKLLELQNPDQVFKSLTEPITRATTILFKDTKKFRARDWRNDKEYNYGLQATPITRRLEKKLALIDEVAFALLYGSGLNVIFMSFMSLLKSSDHVLIPENCYSPTTEIMQFLSSNYQIKFSTYNPLKISKINFKKNTRLIWIETPGSITMEICNLREISSIAKAKGVMVGVDATWSAGVAFNPFKQGADFAIYALTKYQSGGSDVFMGAMTTNNKSIYEKLFFIRTICGISVSPEDVYLILRNLPHLKLRYLSQDQSARQIASWLKNQPCIDRVLHPHIKDCPGHEIWLRDYAAGASIFSVVFKESISQDQVDLFINSLKLFHIGFSWGGSVSLVLPFSKKQINSHYPYQGSSTNYPYKGCLVRLYVGLEESEDLIEDLKQALHKIKI